MMVINENSTGLCSNEVNFLNLVLAATVKLIKTLGRGGQRACLLFRRSEF